MRLFGLDTRLWEFPFFNRRKTKRVPTHEHLYIEYEDLEFDTNGSAKGEDISTGGICFACDLPFPSGTLLNLTFRFSAEFGMAHPFQTQARVVHSYKKPEQRHYRVGASFDSLNPTVRDQIQGFINLYR